MKKNTREFLGKIGAVALALLIWQMVAGIVHQKILIVGPIEVLLRMGTIWQVEGFWRSIGYTFLHIVSGFLLGALLGILLAALAHRFGWMKTLLWPFMATIKAVPVASFVVICLIWLTARNLSIFISFLIVIPVIYQNTLAGLSAQDEKMCEIAKVYHLPWYKRLRYIVLPQLKPYLLSSLSVTAGMAWKAGVAAEVIGTPNGSIGKMLYLAKISLATEDLLAWTVIIVVLSVGFEKIFVFLAGKILGKS